MTVTHVRDAKRARLTEALADIVLAEGLDSLSLRPAAARLGTSDRMLLYYFGTKAALMTEVLGCVTARFGAWLGQQARGIKIPPHQMIGHTAALMGEPDARPYVGLWFEIAARASRGDALYAATAEQIAEQWTDWIVSRVHFPAGVQSRSAAAMMLAIVNGLSMLDSTAPAVATAARARVQTAAA